jgi:uncharacterized repeat protein (TIGR03806 family)
MTLRRRLRDRSTLSSLLFFSALLTAAVLACGSDDVAGGTGDPPGSGGEQPDSSSTTPDGGGSEDDGPIVKKEFPLTTPAIGGYTLVDAFPGVVFDIPAAITWPKTPGAAPFVLERTGQIRTIANGERRDLLDFGSKVHVGGEGGALGLALHPQFGNGTNVNQYVYVWYNACDVPGCQSAYTQRLERYTWDAASSTFFPDSASTLIEEREYENVHNSGKVLFGPDGFLYFGNGDDIQTNNHQTITNGLFAGIFRIDVDMDPAKSHPPPPHTPVAADPSKPISIFMRQGYFIPNDNPFVNAVPNGLEEFYALGFRNPFGFSFDRQTGDLWMGDVGDSFREEVNQVVKGGNYEWPLKEGELDNDTPIRTYAVGTPTPPKFYYSHAEMADLSSIFGGIVYRGPSLPELNGQYLYTDWISNRVWALDIRQSPSTRTTLVDNQFKMQPMGIGEDNDGEFYILQYGPDFSDEAWSSGRIKKIVRDASRDALPKRLKETTLFDDVPSLTPAADLVSYEVSAPLWSDGSMKRRWIRLPKGEKVTVNPDGTLKFPVGTVFVKQFDLPENMNIAGRSRHLETRVMVVGTDTTYGYTFRWNAAGTDATLVSEAADETLTDSTTGRSQSWHYPSFGQCWECHRNGWEDLANTKRNDKYRILGFTAQQLGVMTGEAGGEQRDQRAVLAEKGVFDAADVAKMPPAIPKPSDTTKSLEERAYAYLAANCSPCHHENAGYTGGGQTWIATYGAGDLAGRHLDRPANNYPMTVRLGIPNGQLVAPGDAARSVLYARIKSNDPDLRMPPIARNVVDDEGAAVIEAWINSLR